MTTASTYREPRSPRILFAGGGTGGHVYPAIAIADAVREQEPGAVIAFIGTEDRLEWKAVPKAGYEIHAIKVAGLQRRLTLKNIAFPFKLIAGLTRSWTLIGAFDPDVVVGTGGYVSGPVLWTASLRGRNTLIQEQNAYPGITNRLLGRKADTIHVAYEEAIQYFARERCKLTGNPTRPELLDASREEGRRIFEISPDRKVLFVFGGSLGAGALNAAMAEQADRLLENSRLHIIWQTGPAYFETYRDTFGSRENVTLLPYVDRMDLAYAASDLVLSRAGAITCSELMVTGSPAILVPSPNVAEDHQTRNARAIETRNGAVLLPEGKLSNQLSDVVSDLIHDEARLSEMSTSMKQMARPQAAYEIAGSVLALAGRRRSSGRRDKNREGEV
jgi:UDP-N-acetylglucosamine--N-acetylmuramyl-(pentapeptide) pyrophosphoryl-undecaprenol N-acetylglucosamine transferase